MANKSLSSGGIKIIVLLFFIVSSYRIMISVNVNEVAGERPATFRALV